MPRLLMSVFIGALCVFFASALSAGVISNSQQQSGNSGLLIFNGDTMRITGSSHPFTFTGYGDLISITSLSIMLTLWDGDTGVGNFARDELSLSLDGYDTGILLNGFRNNHWDTLTISGAPSNASSIFDALQADGQLVARLLYHQNWPWNYVDLGGGCNPPTATLSITGDEGEPAPPIVPEPATFVLLGGGLVALALARRLKK